MIAIDLAPEMIANAQKHQPPDGPQGFHIEQAVEPAADALLAEQQPLYTRVPIFSRFGLVFCSGPVRR